MAKIGILIGPLVGSNIAVSSLIGDITILGVPIRNSLKSWFNWVHRKLVYVSGNQFDHCMSMAEIGVLLGPQFIDVEVEILEIRVPSTPYN